MIKEELKAVKQLEGEIHKYHDSLKKLEDECKTNKLQAYGGGKGCCTLLRR